MDHSTDPSFWELLGNITQHTKHQRLADVCRFISFQPFETFGPHEHLRFEINYVKKGSCTLHIPSESVGFGEKEIMIICSHVSHTFEAGPKGCTLMQLEFLPDLFSCLNSDDHPIDDLDPVSIFTEENRLIKIVNNVRIMRAVQCIISELHQQDPYYRHIVVIYYAELLILLYRYLNENFLPLQANDFLKKAIAYIRTHYQTDISISDIAEQANIGERYLRKLFARHLDLSPVEFLHQTRMNKAIELLHNTELSIKEISFSCGFQSPQYFSRLFKQKMGFSPHELTR